MNFCEKQKNVNISETVRDRAISTEFSTRWVVERYHRQNRKISFFATFGGHLGFFAEKQKNVNISETVRDRAILTEFSTQRVVER